MKRNSFIKTSHRNFRHSLGLAFNFNLIIEVLFGLFFIPTSNYLYNLAIERNKIEFLTNKNFFGILDDPLIIIAFLFLLFLMMLFSLYRMTAMYTLASETSIKSLRKLLIRSLIHLIGGIKKQNIKGLILLVLIHPLANITFLISMYYRYGLDRIYDLNRYNVVPIILLLITINTIFMFAYPIVFLNEKSFKEGIKEGWRLFRQHWIRNVLYYIIAIFLVTIIIFAFFLIFILIFTLININSTNLGIYGNFLSALQIIQSVISLSLVVIFSIVNNFFAVQLYLYCLAEDQSMTACIPIREKTGKKNLVSSILILGIIFTISVAGPKYYRNTYTKYASHFIRTYPEIIAHRGFSAEAPENTISAVVAAIKAKADRVEIDVQLSQDGTVYLMHDSTLLRTTGINNRLTNLNDEEIEQLDAGSWFSEDFEGEKIPKLSEVLEVCKGKISLKIELKPQNGNEVRLAEAVINDVKEADMSQNVMISSFSKNAIMTVKKLDKKIISGLIVTFIYGEYSGITYADGIIINQNFLNLEQAKAIQRADKLVYSWTPNSYEDLRAVNRLGVDGIITDYPQRARAVVYGESYDITIKNIIFRIIINLTDPLRS
jgi:glycerophosphoryl diester phosphodiesterase